ncbi:diacylglycerol/lipid kinase family protein [Parvularcula sp. LCG005]|uniref:diacylglycerol/lipid kinase family protein n=1 Tax=Parvularcula sp. LCG005 TaxID=3078805 RepID=UPI0029434E3C|nr:diacylglycerol kinase family protein [Parvularcula sp. LCG005]WOI52909.1 diacylglycerol kinase family protein [Parvularcula sp. LCG005]
MICIINKHSGSVPPDAETAIVRLLNDLEQPADILVCDGENLKAQIADAISQRPETMIIWGGDGTIACALNQAIGTDTAILPLPGGTMNMLHHSVHLSEAGWQDILAQALLHGHKDPLSAGVVDGNRFFVAALIGNLARMADPRESLRHGNLIEAATQFTDSHAFDTSQQFRMKINGTEQVKDVVAIGSFVPRHDRGEGFEIGTIIPETPLGIMQAAAEAALMGWRDAPSINYERAEGFQISATDREVIPCTLDGERMDLSATIDITFERDVVSVISARR